MYIDKGSIVIGVRGLSLMSTHTLGVEDSKMVELKLLYWKNWRNSPYKNQHALYISTTCDRKFLQTTEKSCDKKVLEDNRTTPVYTELPEYINKEVSSSSDSSSFPQRQTSLEHIEREYQHSCSFDLFDA